MYWYRFTDEMGHTSRVGRTLTAPAENDPRPVKFAFISCQNVNQGSQHAYRRMIFEDERAPASRAAGLRSAPGRFHLRDRLVSARTARRACTTGSLRDIVRYEHGEKIQDFHIPTTVDDYRAVYRAYLHDPDLQDARARLPFVPMWDNHEFSWLGWQSFQVFDGSDPAGRRPARWRPCRPGSNTNPPASASRADPDLERFDPPKVVNAPITRFDAHGLGQEPNNLAALASLTGYRAMRWGRHVELIITDQRSYRSEEPTSRPEAQDFVDQGFPRAHSRRRRWRSWMRDGSTPAASRRTPLPSATSRSPTSASTSRRRPFSAPSRKRGS